jgi:hypothetical protein
MSTFPVRAFAALALYALPVAAMAQEFDGVYEYAFCDNPPFVALTIAGAEVSYYDTPCTLSDAAPQAQPAGAIQYTMACDHGSGPQPQTVVFFRDAEGALVLRSNGLEDRFVNCTAD